MDIEALIPHRGRMKLIDGVLDLNEEASITSARVTDRWPLYQDAFVDPLVLIEVVAQTAAVHISGKRERGKTDNQQGWIVGIKNADFFLGPDPCRYTPHDNGEKYVSYGKLQCP